MKAAKKSQRKARSRPKSGLSKVMKAVTDAVKDNVMAAEKYLDGGKGRARAKSTKASRPRYRPIVDA